MLFRYHLLHYVRILTSLTKKKHQRSFFGFGDCSSESSLLKLIQYKNYHLEALVLQTDGQTKMCIYFSLFNLVDHQMVHYCQKFGTRFKFILTISFSTFHLFHLVFVVIIFRRSFARSKIFAVDPQIISHSLNKPQNQTAATFIIQNSNNERRYSINCMDDIEAFNWE